MSIRIPNRPFVAGLGSAVALLALAGCPNGESPNPPSPDRIVEPAHDPPTPAPVAETDTTLAPELVPMFQLINAGRSGPARVRLRKHLNQHPEDGQAEFLFALSYHQEKKYGEARPHYERAAELAPCYPTTPYFYGWSLFYLGEMEAARAQWLAHLQIAPDSYDTHFGLGLIDLEMDELDDAEERFDRALELAGEATSPRERSKIHTRLAEVHLARADDEAARASLDTALALMPDNGEAAYKLYRLLLKLGLEDEAEAARLRYEETRS